MPLLCQKQRKKERKKKRHIHRLLGKENMDRMRRGDLWWLIWMGAMRTVDVEISLMREACRLEQKEGFRDKPEVRWWRGEGQRSSCRRGHAAIGIHVHGLFDLCFFSSTDPVSQSLAVYIYIYIKKLWFTLLIELGYKQKKLILSFGIKYFREIITQKKETLEKFLKGTLYQLFVATMAIIWVDFAPPKQFLNKINKF